MKDITEENTLENMEQKDRSLSSEAGKSVDCTSKDSNFAYDYSVQWEGDDHETQNLSTENSPSKYVDTLPVQCTEDVLLTCAEEEGSRPESKDDQHSQVRVSADDIDLPHNMHETELSEYNGPHGRVAKLKYMLDSEREKFVDKEELRLKYTEEEKTNRKLPLSNQVQSGPLDIQPFLKPLPGPQHSFSVYMLHSFTAQVSGPNRGSQSKDNVTSPQQYLTEMSRLATFIDYPYDIPIFAITLAKDGFVFLLDKQLIECFFCKLPISLSDLRSPDADPVRMHCSRSPGCPLKRGEGCENVPVPRVGENGILSNNQSHESRDANGTNTHSALNMASGSRDNLDKRPPDSWYRGGEATVLPSPVIHHNPLASITTDGVPVSQQVQTLPPSSRSNTDRITLQPGNADDSVQQRSLQQPNLPPTASSARTAETVPDGAAAPVNPKGSTNGDSRNRGSSSPPSSGQNAIACSSSAHSGASTSAAASPPKNTKSSKKTKAAKKAEAASRRMPASSSASASSIPASAQNFSTRSNSTSSSDKADKDKDKKKLSYADLGIFAEKPKRPDMASLQKRLGTFEGKWKTSYAKSPQTLAECGMYYAGYADCARCFFCGGGLKNWEDPDEPWVEHARWFPKCAYLLLCKSPMFAEIVQRKNKNNEKIVLKDIEKEINQKTKISERPAASLPASVTASEVGEAAAPPPRNSTVESLVVDLAQLEAENEELTTQVTCKICMDERSSVVFLPCGHMVACTDCAVVLKNCPLCRADIKGSVKAQI